MEKKTLSLAIVFVIMSGLLIAQNKLDKLPDNPKPGKCYVKCIEENVFETKTVRILTKPAYKKLVIVPPVYKTEEERIMIKPETKRYEYIPAVLKTERVVIQVEDPASKLRIIPAKFGPSSERIQTDPAYANWDYRKKPDCVSPNPNDCITACWVETPARFRDVPTKNLITDATTTATKGLPKKLTVSKQVIVKPATTKEIIIPAKYRTVKKRVLVSDETVREITVPAEYRNETVRVLKTKAGTPYWVEIDCKLTEFNILPIYYELNSARLTVASKRTLDNTIYKLMKEKPGIKIELASHTDARGTVASNLELSQRRAQSVINYLVSKGISRNRLIANGYGESRLVNRCADGVSCTAAEHQKNRRTEFRVIGN